MDTQIQIRDGRVVNVDFYENSQSHTTLFFIHGLGGRGNQWRAQIPFLKTDHNLVIPDHYGLGKSKKANGMFSNPYSFSEINKDMIEIFDQYSTQNNIVLGHSYGGALATSLALARKEKINKIILLNPIPCEPGYPLPWFFRLPAFMLEWMRTSLENNFNQMAYDPSANPKLILEETIMSRQNKLSIIKEMAKGLQQTPKIDLKSFKNPFLIIIGEHDKVVDPKIGILAYEDLPSHHFAVIKQAGHMVMLEKPDQVNKIISDFLK